MKPGIVYVVDPTKNENLEQDRIISGTVVVRNPRRPGFASIALEKTEFNFDAGNSNPELKRKGGFMNQKRIVHFIGGPEEDLLNFARAFDLKGGDDFNQKTGLKKDIVVKETTIKPFEGANAKINPTTGEAMVTLEGEPIYRVTQLMDKNDPDCFTYAIDGIGESAFATLQGQRDAVFDVNAPSRSTGTM